MKVQPSCDGPTLAPAGLHRLVPECQCVSRKEMCSQCMVPADVYTVEQCRAGTGNLGSLCRKLEAGCNRCWFCEACKMV